MPHVDGTSVYITGSVGIGNLTPTEALNVSGAVSACEGFIGNLTGQAATVATIAGLAPNTATTQATQPNITSLGTLGSLTVTGQITGNGDSALGNATTDSHTIFGATHIKGNLTGSGAISSSLGNTNGVSANHYITATETKGAAGNAQANAQAIGNTGVVFITGADGTKGVSLPDIGQLKSGHTITLYNTNESADLKVYPVSGQSIAPKAANQAVTVSPHQALVVHKIGSDGYRGYLTTVIT
jgi:hypothetical protein